MAIMWNQDMITAMLQKVASKMNHDLNGENVPPAYLFAVVVMENKTTDSGTAMVSNIDNVDALAAVLAEQAMALHQRLADHEVIEEQLD